MSTLTVVPDQPPEELGEIVIASVRAEMARRNLKQADLAELLDLGQASISERMTGKKLFTLNEVGYIARWLAVPISVLTGETGQGPGSDPGGGSVRHGGFEPPTH